MHTDQPLANIQAHLQSLYDLELDYRVDDFLVTDPRFPQRAQGDSNARDCDEKLLFCESDGELLLSLYLDEDLVQTMRDADPYRQLEADHLGDFCTAVEGVSHFVYLAYNASHERPVSQLELELQAEVDKYVVVWTLSERQGRAVGEDALAHWLFDRCRFDPALGAGEHRRYRRANRLARAFCKRVRDLPANAGRRNLVMRELRRFYRKRHLDKVDSALAGAALRAP